jgi:hypothetical protein
MFRCRLKASSAEIQSRPLLLIYSRIDTSPQINRLGTIGSSEIGTAILDRAEIG